MNAIGRLRASLLQGPIRDHEVIRQWAARHSAVPAEIKPRKFDGEPAILWFLFDSRGSEEIVAITWENFFALFDLLGLHMMVDETPYFELVHTQKSPEELGLLPA